MVCLFFVVSGGHDNDRPLLLLFVSDDSVEQGNEGRQRRQNRLVLVGDESFTGK